ncbi:MAG: hypothetical protein N4A59_10910 [Marinifilum sp.]|jgi:hypothetical protein|nr:hypothetical protein [Marinifilum sp.]
MNRFTKKDITVKPKSKEEYLCLLENFCQNPNRPYFYQCKSEESFYLERKCLNGMSLNLVKIVFPYRLQYTNRNQEAAFSMNFMLNGHVDYSVQQAKSCISAGENNILIVPDQSHPSFLFAANTY